MKKPSDVLTTKEAAEAKGVHLNSIYTAVKDGRLKSERRGGVILIRRRDLDEWQPIGHRPKTERRPKMELAAGQFDEEDVMRRAFAAWFRQGVSVDQPANTSGVADHGGRSYAVLRNVNGVLAVYRVQNDGSLRKVIRWPKQLEDY